MCNNLPFPDVSKRKKVSPSTLYRGRIVAFKIPSDDCPSKANDCQMKYRTGVLIAESPDWLIAAYNLYYEEGRIWVEDNIPSDIELYESDYQEKIWAYKYFLEELKARLYSINASVSNERLLIDFIEDETRSGLGGPTEFQRDLVSYVDSLLDEKQLLRLKSELTALIDRLRDSGFDTTMSNYCYLLSVLKIIGADKELEYWDIINDNWTVFAELYKIYLSDELDVREKLDRAFQEARYQGKFDLISPGLYDIYTLFFSKPFKEVVSAMHASETVEELRAQLAAKDELIEELKTALSDQNYQFDDMLDTVNHAVGDGEKDNITGEDLKASFLRFKPDLALRFFESLSNLLASNRAWQKYAPEIHEAILAKQEAEQNQPRMSIYGDYVQSKHVEHEVGHVDSGAVGISLNKSN